MTALIDVVGWGLVHSLWQLAVLAALYGGVCGLLPRRAARWRYGIGMTIMAAMCLAPVVFGCHAALARGGEQSALELSPSPPWWRAEEAIPRSPGDHGDDRAGTMLASWRMSVEQRLPLIVLAWLAGVGVSGVRLGASASAVCRLRSSAAPSPPRVSRALAALVARVGLRRRVEVRASRAIDAPIVFGILRPMVLLPISMVAAVPPAQLELLLLHELVHVRRHDYLINLCQCVAETMFFFHPAMWWIQARIREEREYLCDDMVVELSGRGGDYVHALVALEELRSATPAAALGAGGGRLAQRVRRIVGRDSVDGMRSVAATVLAVVAAILFASAGMVPVLTSQSRPASGAATDIVDIDLAVFAAPPGAAELLGPDWVSPGPGLGQAVRSPAAPELDAGRLHASSDLGWRLGAAQRRGLLTLVSKPEVATLLGEEATVITGASGADGLEQTLRLQLRPELARQGLMLHVAARLGGGESDATILAQLSVAVWLAAGDSLLLVGSNAGATATSEEELLVLVTPHRREAMAP